MSDPIQKPLINFIIDEHHVSVPKGTTVYQACQQLGIDIPIFCYQDRLTPFGACRMCLVEVEKMSKPQTSCTLEATEGMVVKTQSDQIKEERKGILELLLINHPLDCPTCDKGGECPLQDNVMRHGPGVSRFCEKKRTFIKPLFITPVLVLDRERCIACARCVRFCEDLSGDCALSFVERGYLTEIGTVGKQAENSKFIGNTISICPVGALTSNVYRFKSRPWDNVTHESSCTLCPIGCRQYVDSRDEKIVRTSACEQREVNDLWLCDKGWFGYSHATHPDRLNSPLIRKNGQLEPTSWEEALNLVVSKMKPAMCTGRMAAFGGNPLTFEENYLFQKLFREGLQSPHIDHRIGMPQYTLEEESYSPKLSHSFQEVEQLDFTLLLGLDITEQFPLLWLRLRQALHRGAEVWFVGHKLPEIARYLQSHQLHSPGEEIQIVEEQLKKIQVLLRQGKRGSIFVGDQYLSSLKRLDILKKLSQFSSTERVFLNLLEGRGNSLGARYAGVHPYYIPFGRKAEKRGYTATEVLIEASQKGWDVLYVAGANPALKFPSQLWRSARERLSFLVVNDLFMTETAKMADVVFPVVNAFEKGGTFINIEGRKQSLTPCQTPPENLFSDGEIFSEIGRRLNLDMRFSEEFANELVQNKLTDVHPISSEIYERDESALGEDELYISMSRSLFDKGIRMQHNTDLFQLVDNPSFRVSSRTGKRLQLQEGKEIQIFHKNNALMGMVTFDDTVSENTLIIPLGFECDLPVYDLGSQLRNGMKVRVISCG